MATLTKFVGVRGFEPPASRPPDVHSNRAELHPVLWCGRVGVYFGVGVGVVVWVCTLVWSCGCGRVIEVSSLG